MEIVPHDPAAAGDFDRVVRPLLDADPLRPTVILTVLDGLGVADGPPNTC